ncbi:hypothetical protein L1077_07305 [Pseudoalteromonas luteoviolacea]|uniref:hypothetical protein n=1 Tax=Pseudoalteromonas luteoviolacea TaxID=43657 RepID=UPI001F4543B6|nr:hypothetical protein [Pseudoalteromonas luteoviolacea]MCF6439231.1 hypothetical protein [Pseudoalteromonas luteoviolacea]
MKKILLALVTGTAIASGGYYITQKNSNSEPLPQLDYVPADTLFLWSQLKSFPYLQYFDLLPKSYKNVQQIEDVIATMKSDDMGVNQHFILNILEQYSKSAESSEHIQGTWGINNDLKFLAYSVGLLPVLRAEFGDPNIFKATIKQAADEAGLQYEEIQIEGAPVTKYFIDYEGERIFDLLIASNGNWLTITIDTPFNQPNDVKVALGLAKPLHALSDSGKIEGFIKGHQLDGHSLAYLDTQLITEMLTAKNPDSQATLMLDKLTSLAGEDNAFDSIRTPECQQDFSDITQKWPAIISGTQKVDITSQFADLKVSTVIASSDTKILSALQNMRGFLPQHTQSSNDAMVTLGLGLNANQLSSSVNTVWAAFASAQFDCAPLNTLQAQTKGVNPAPLAMATGMLGSFKGISATIFDMDVTTFYQPDEFDTTALDALVTVSADDVQALFNMAKSLVPEFTSLTLPGDGTAIEINDYLPQGVSISTPVYLALKGQHLALYKGDMAEKAANDLSNQAVTINGFASFGLDSAKIFPKLFEAAKQSGEPIPDELKDLFNQTGKMHVQYDIDDKGIVFDVDVKITK